MSACPAGVCGGFADNHAPCLELVNGPVTTKCSECGRFTTHRRDDPTPAVCTDCGPRCEQCGAVAHMRNDGLCIDCMPKPTKPGEAPSPIEALAPRPFGRPRDGGRSFGFRAPTTHGAPDWEGSR